MGEFEVESERHGEDGIPIWNSSEEMVKVQLNPKLYLVPGVRTVDLPSCMPTVESTAVRVCKAGTVRHGIRGRSPMVPSCR